MPRSTLRGRSARARAGRAPGFYTRQRRRRGEPPRLALAQVRGGRAPRRSAPHRRPARSPACAPDAGASAAYGDSRAPPRMTRSAPSSGLGPGDFGGQIRDHGIPGRRRAPDRREGHGTHARAATVEAREADQILGVGHHPGARGDDHEPMAEESPRAPWLPPPWTRRERRAPPSPPPSRSFRTRPGPPRPAPDEGRRGLGRARSRPGSPRTRCRRRAGPRRWSTRRCQFRARPSAGQDRRTPG